MRLKWLTDRLDRRLEQVRRRPPDVIIGGAENAYMLRWFVIPRNRWFNIYHHEVRRDDDDRALHDHPWVSVSIVLHGRLREVLSHDGNRSRVLAAGRIVMRTARAAHRLELIDGAPCRTLFLTGPRMRQWGFHCPQGWRHWKDFTGFNQSGDSTRVGPGCD